MSSNSLYSLPVVRPVLSITAPLHTVPHPSLYGFQGFCKRAIDVFGSLAGLALLAPVLLLVAIAIKLDSPGAVIFKQRRVGLDGAEFDMYKFRSMVVEAEAMKADLLALNEMKDGPIFKMARDPRVTRVGRFIRRTSLDEFPQLVNVLSGKMSLVGPRPPLPSEVAYYTAEQRQRLSVIPGATGLWQVSGRSNLESFRTMVGLDLEYIRNWSLVSDLRIIFKTVLVVLKMEGSC